MEERHGKLVGESAADNIRHQLFKLYRRQTTSNGSHRAQYTCVSLGCVRWVYGAANNFPRQQDAAKRDDNIGNVTPPGAVQPVLYTD